MNAEIISVGTEILLGDIVNTNARFLSQELAALGISVYYQTAVGDNKERILKALNNAFERSDMVITTGGLGPTEDDLTKEAGAAYFNKQMIMDGTALAEIEQYFNKLGYEMTPNNKKQALIPEGAVSLKNEIGTAPGAYIDENGKILAMLPGPPREMTIMFKNHLAPVLKEKQELTFVSKVMHICGIGESAVDNMICDMLKAQTNPTIAPYAKQNEVSLRITASAESEEEAYKIIGPVKEELYKRLGHHIYGEDETTLAEAVVKALTEKNLTISAAESCTGGALSSCLVECPGVSRTLIESVVAYSNESKVKRLHVAQETLDCFGAVSRETAEEMARGAAIFSGADVGISTTGVAGPNGGTPEKPAGLVYIGLYINGEVKSKQLTLSGTRERIRTRSVVTALNWLRNELAGI